MATVITVNVNDPAAVEAILAQHPKVGFKRRGELRVHPKEKANGAPHTRMRGESYTYLNLGAGFFAILPIGKGGTAEEWGLPTFNESKPVAPPVAEAAEEEKPKKPAKP